MNDHKELRLLLVPDSIHWVTGTMAKEIASKVKGINPIICSAPLLHELITQHGGSFPILFDVVHFLTPYIATAFWPVFSPTSACVASIHHIDNDLNKEPASYSDSIMTVCQEWHNQLILEGVDEERLVMVRNGINTEVFYPSSLNERDQLRRQYCIPEDSFVIGFSAKKSSDSSNRKGINVLEKLIAESRTNSSSVWWVIRGPGWQNLVDEQSQLGANIIYLPFLLEQEDVAKSYRLMDAYIVTSRIEGGPVPLFEAMSSGLSCISTKVGLAPEIMEDGKNGFLVDFDDLEKFSTLISQLEKDKELRSRIGISARDAIVNNLQWEKTLDNVPILYEKATSAFSKRAEYIEKKNINAPNDKWSESYLRKWIQKRELLVLINLLNREGESITSCKLAESKLREYWMDLEIWYLYFEHSNFAKILKPTKKVISNVKTSIKNIIKMLLN